MVSKGECHKYISNEIFPSSDQILPLNVNAQPSVRSYKNRHHDGDGYYFLMKQFSGISGDHGMNLST